MDGCVAAQCESGAGDDGVSATTPGVAATCSRTFCHGFGAQLLRRGCTVLPGRWTSRAAAGDLFRRQDDDGRWKVSVRRTTCLEPGERR